MKLLKFTYKNTIKLKVLKLKTVWSSEILKYTLNCTVPK